MGSLLDWCRGKLSAAPEGSCAFWVDVRHLLAGNGGLADTDEQPLRDDRGREWRLVRYRANPFAARRALADSSIRTLVWCTGTPGETRTDLTPFEDHLPRAHHLAEISLRALARERAPGLELPAQLDLATRGSVSDADALIAAIARHHGNAPVTLTSALNVLIEERTGARGGIDTSSAARVLCSVALAFTGARDSSATEAVRTTLRAIADANTGLSPLLTALAASEPADVVATVHLGAALGRLKVPNAGAVLAAEGICPAPVFRAFESERTAGHWSALPAALSEADIAQLASWYEASGDELSFGRLSRLLSNVRPALELAATEPVAQVRLATLLGMFDSFLEARLSSANAACLPSAWTEDLRALDALVAPLRLIADGSLDPPPRGVAMDQCARTFVAGPISSLELAIAEAKLAFAALERVLPKAIAEPIRGRLAEAQRSLEATIDDWDRAWASAIQTDVAGYLSAPQQTWRRSRTFAEGTKTQRWLLVFDGLRYDLWGHVLRPALRDAGFVVDGDDFAFTYLPSITEVSRRTLVGGTASIASMSEASLAERLANQSGFRHTY